MVERVIKWDIDAWNDYVSWQAEDKKTLKRINQIIKDIVRDPFNGIAKPEPLKGSLTGFWSRRIDSTNRIVYAVESDAILKIECRTHYEQ